MVEHGTVDVGLSSPAEASHTSKHEHEHEVPSDPAHEGRRRGPGKDPESEKPPEPEGSSGLSPRTIRCPSFRRQAGSVILSVFVLAAKDLPAPHARMEPIWPRRHADPGARGKAHRAVGRQLERFREVVVEVPGRSAGVAGQGEAGQGRQSQVQRTADPGLEHPSAPYGDAPFEAEVMDPFRLEDPSDPSLLDVHDPTGEELERGGRIGGRADRFVEAEIGPQERLQLRVPEQVLVVEGLFDHQEIRIVHRAEHLGVGRRVRAVRVDGEEDSRVDGANGAYAIDVDAGFDLELDTKVACSR